MDILDNEIKQESEPKTTQAETKRQSHSYLQMTPLSMWKIPKNVPETLRTSELDSFVAC